MKKNFTVEQMKAALLAVQDKISPPQMSMLRAHYMYRTLSTQRIAVFGGYGSYSAANLWYGKVGGLTAKQLGVVGRGKIHTIASGWDNDSDGYFQLRLDTVVVKALDKLGWFKGIAGEGPAPGSEELSITETEREALVKARVGQGIFRSDVVALW